MKSAFVIAAPSSGSGKTTVLNLIAGLDAVEPLGPHPLRTRHGDLEAGVGRLTELVGDLGQRRVTVDDRAITRQAGSDQTMQQVGITQSADHERVESLDEINRAAGAAT